MKKPGKEKWLHNRGYLAELTYERPTKNFTAPSFSLRMFILNITIVVVLV